MNTPLHLPFAPREITYASSTITTTDSDNRTRKRRSHGSSSDRAPTPTEDRIIEVDYRAGGPVLCESPCISNLFQHALPREHKYYNLVANEAHKVARPIVHLCNDEDIGGLVGVHLVGRRSVYALQDEPVPMLLVSTNTSGTEVMDGRGRGDYDTGLGSNGDFTIGCFRVGGKIYTRDRYWKWTVKESRKRCPPTVVIGVDRLVKRDWTQVRVTVITILDARGLDEVAVLIRKDSDSRIGKVVGDWDPQDSLGVQNCRQDPVLGSSINNSRAVGDAAFGTLGAWVEIQELTTGNWVPMALLALTSANCCLPPEERLSAEDVQEWKKDREAMKEYLDNGGNLFGEVFASSGLRVAPSTEDASKLSIRDWALVRPNADHSIGKNDIGIVTTLAGRELGPLCRHLPITDQSLWTIGRNTSNVRWKYTDLKVYHISRPMTDGRKQPILTWEHAMVRNGHVGPLGDERDSGALVLDQVGRAIGMVFGGSMSGDLVYFTSARDLVDDINRSKLDSPLANELTSKVAGPANCRPDPPAGEGMFSSILHESRGTLGGWVEVYRESTKTWVPLALTCSHVALPSEGDVAAANATGNDDSTFRTVEAILAQPDPFVIPSDRSDWKIQADIIREKTEEKTVMNRFLQGKRHILGSVLAASGAREVKSTDKPSDLSIRDWALVELNSNRSAGANMVKIPTQTPLERLVGFSITPVEPGATLMKYGRASGVLSAPYSGLATCSVASRVSNGQTVFLDTWEHTFTYGKESGKFVCREGDSGSLVFNKDKKGVGLMFGGSKTQDLGYFTSTHDLFDDIKRSLGVTKIRLLGDQGNGEYTP
ncbi:hypothetical protein BJX65DRAFT_304931 [Aspergillus insuetus]